jgi:hypothetical protein
MSFPKVEPIIKKDMRLRWYDDYIHQLRACDRIGGPAPSPYGERTPILLSGWAKIRADYIRELRRKAAS